MHNIMVWMTCYTVSHHLYCLFVVFYSVDQSLVNPDEDCVYFCGNSLGICPKKTRDYMNVEIDKWEKT